ncbi:MAG: hypothetical protein RIS85_2238, partial [Pseudomonadota bacterium]
MAFHMRMGHLAGIATALLASTAMAGDIVGTVTGPGGKPLAGASVSVDDLMRTATTDAKGMFRFDRVPEGKSTVNIGSMFLATQHVTVDVPATGETQLSAQLKPNTALGRAAQLNAEPPVEHLSQKQAYLAAIPKT